MDSGYIHKDARLGRFSLNQCHRQSQRLSTLQHYDEQPDTVTWSLAHSLEGPVHSFGSRQRQRSLYHSASMANMAVQNHLLAARKAWYSKASRIEKDLI